MLLTNYIDKYQEKLGLYGTKSKQSEVDKVLAFTHQDLAKKANASEAVVVGTYRPDKTDGEWGGCKRCAQKEHVNHIRNRTPPQMCKHPDVAPIKCRPPPEEREWIEN